MMTQGLDLFDGWDLIKFVTLGVLCIQYYAYKISFPVTKKGQCALETVHGVSVVRAV